MTPIVPIFKFAKQYINIMDLNAQLEYAKDKQVKVNETSVLEPGKLVLFTVAIGQQGTAFHCCDNEQCYCFRDLLKKLGGGI